MGTSGVRCIWDKACLVLSDGHPLRQFTDEMADEHMGFLDAWNRLRRDTEGDIGDICQRTALPKEGYCASPKLLGRT